MARHDTFIPEDYEDLYTYYFQPSGSPVRRMVAKKVPYASEEDHEDLIHQVYERMLRFKCLEKFDPMKSSFGWWVFTVVRSVCANYCASVHRTPTRMSVSGGGNIDNFFNAGIEADQVETVAAREALGYLVNHVEASGNPELELMLNQMAEGETGTEIAKVLGCALSKTTYWRHRFEEIAEG